MVRTTLPMPLVVLALMAGVALAGCVGNGGPSSTPAGLGSVTVDFDASTGSVLGAVYDESQLPVEGAFVEIPDTEFQATTNPEGAFVLNRVPPGHYAVRVLAPGFHPAEARVSVEAGRLLDGVVFRLEPAPSDEPYIQYLIHEGYEACTMTVGVFVNPGSPAIWQTLCQEEPAVRYNFTLAETWRYLIVEMDWRTSDSMWLTMMPDVQGASCNTGSSNWCWQDLGGSPLRMDSGPDDEEKARAYALDGETPIAAGEQVIRLSASYGGNYRETVNGTFGDQCNLLITTGLGPLGQQWNENLGCGLGYGYSAGVRFTYYATIFHWEAPRDPSAHTGLPDQ